MTFLSIINSSFPDLCSKDKDLGKGKVEEIEAEAVTGLEEGEYEYLLVGRVGGGGVASSR